MAIWNRDQEQHETESSPNLEDVHSGKMPIEAGGERPVDEFAEPLEDVAHRLPIPSNPGSLIDPAHPRPLYPEPNTSTEITLDPSHPEHLAPETEKEKKSRKGLWATIAATTGAAVLATTILFGGGDQSQGGDGRTNNDNNGSQIDTDKKDKLDITCSTTASTRSSEAPGRPSDIRQTATAFANYLYVASTQRVSACMAEMLNPNELGTAAASEEAERDLDDLISTVSRTFLTARSDLVEQGREQSDIGYNVSAITTDADNYGVTELGGGHVSLEAPLQLHIIDNPNRQDIDRVDLGTYVIELAPIEVKDLVGTEYERDIPAFEVVSINTATAEQPSNTQSEAPSEAAPSPSEVPSQQPQEGDNGYNPDQDQPSEAAVAIESKLEGRYEFVSNYASSQFQELESISVALDPNWYKSITILTYSGSDEMAQGRNAMEATYNDLGAESYTVTTDRFIITSVDPDSDTRRLVDDVAKLIG